MRKTAAAAFVLSFNLIFGACSGSAATAGEPPKGAAAARTPLACKGAPARTGPARGNPKARAVAQRGLEYLAKASADWTKKNRCFGCHVQAVTLEALAVGNHHQ